MNAQRVAAARPPRALPARPAGLALLALLAASVLARLPALVNARGVHSDAAIVGLQARHILDGEWSWFLWGAGYQASFDAAVVALAFAVTGPSALTLMAVPLVGHLILVGLSYDVVRRAVGPHCALIACVPLVFAPQAINGVALYAPRQWSITFAVLAVWLAVRSVDRALAPIWLAGAGFATTFALYLDLFTVQLLPGLALLTVWCAGSPAREAGSPSREAGSPSREAASPSRAAVRRRFVGLGGGALVGMAVLAVSRSQPVADGSKAGVTLDRLGANWDLLVGTCLPYLLGVRVFIPDGTVGEVEWAAPWPYLIVQVVAGLVFLCAFGWAAVAVVRRTGPAPARMLGALGVVVTGASLGGFLVSTMPVDLLSTRYIAPIVWFAPFLFAPAAAALGTRRFGTALAPYLVAGAVGGWLAFGPYVDGALPVRDPRGVAADEAALGAELRARGVEYAAAQYWLSYRLTFLFDEYPVVVPLDGDRYEPYRAGFRAADEVAYLFHPSEPRADPDAAEVELRASGQRYERLEVRGFTVLLADRACEVTIQRSMATGRGSYAATVTHSVPMTNR